MPGNPQPLETPPVKTVGNMAAIPGSVTALPHFQFSPDLFSKTGPELLPAPNLVLPDLSTFPLQTNTATNGEYKFIRLRSSRNRGTRNPQTVAAWRFSTGSGVV
jgi:hypothetical protein